MNLGLALASPLNCPGAYCRRPPFQLMEDCQLCGRARWDGTYLGHDGQCASQRPQLVGSELGAATGLRRLCRSRRNRLSLRTQGPGLMGMPVCS